jgi:hypothetical protein
MRDFWLEKRFNRFQVLILLPVLATSIHYLLTGHI